MTLSGNILSMSNANAGTLPFLLFAPPPQESPPAPPEATNALLPDMIRCNGTAGLYPPLFLSVLPHRRDKELVASLGVIRVKAVIIRNLATNGLRAMDLLI